MFLTVILSALSLSVLPIASQQDAFDLDANGRPGAGAMVCKYQARTGTRFKRKTCRTRAQWDEIAENSRQTMKETVDRPQIDISRCQGSNC